MHEVLLWSLEIINMRLDTITALRGDSLDQFGVEERMAWAKNRQTTGEEDSAYCNNIIYKINKTHYISTNFSIVEFPSRTQSKASPSIKV
jgi:hypothetical protein